MTKRLIGFIMLMLLVVPIAIASAQTDESARYAGKKILYISDEAHTGWASDQKGATYLKDRGADVTVISHDTAGEYDPDEYDLVIISSVVNSGVVASNPQYFQTTTSILNWEAYLLNSFSVASPSLVSTNSIQFIPVPHSITAGFQGAVQISDAPIAELHVGTPNAPGVRALAIANTDSGQLGALFFVDRGGELSNGQQSLNRFLHFPGSDHLFDDANENLVRLFFQAVDWLLED